MDMKYLLKIDYTFMNYQSIATSELLPCHKRFGPISFRKLKKMVQHNIIPSHLANNPTPTFTVYIFAKATRKKWRNKKRKNWSETRTAEDPGDMLSFRSTCITYYWVYQSYDNDPDKKEIQVCDIICQQILRNGIHVSSEIFRRR